MESKLWLWCYEQRHSEGKDAVNQLYEELKDIVVDKEELKNKISNIITQNEIYRRDCISLINTKEHTQKTNTAFDNKLYAYKEILEILEE